MRSGWIRRYLFARRDGHHPTLTAVLSERPRGTGGRCMLLGDTGRVPNLSLAGDSLASPVARCTRRASPDEGWATKILNFNIALLDLEYCVHENIRCYRYGEESQNLHENCSYYGSQTILIGSISRFLLADEVTCWSFRATAGAYNRRHVGLRTA